VRRGQASAAGAASVDRGPARSASAYARAACRRQARRRLGADRRGSRAPRRKERLLAERVRLSVARSVKTRLSNGSLGRGIERFERGPGRALSRRRPGTSGRSPRWRRSARSHSRSCHPLHPPRDPARVLDDFRASARLLAPRARRQGRRRLEHAGRPVHPHAGYRGGEEQLDVGHQAQSPVRAGAGQEDDVANHRMPGPRSHVLRWQIGRVGFNGPAAPAPPVDLVAGTGALGNLLEQRQHPAQSPQGDRPKSIAAGTVSTHERKMRRVTPQRTADKRRADPTPMIDDVIACVVLIGMPSSDAPWITDAPATSAAKP
jgi:hypothetical protein